MCLTLPDVSPVCLTCVRLNCPLTCACVPAAINRADIQDTDMEAIMDTVVDSLFCFFVTLGEFELQLYSLTCLDWNVWSGQEHTDVSQLREIKCISGRHEPFWSSFLSLSVLLCVSTRWKCLISVRMKMKVSNLISSAGSDWFSWFKVVFFYTFMETWQSSNLFIKFFI